MPRIRSIAPQVGELGPRFPVVQQEVHAGKPVRKVEGLEPVKRYRRLQSRNQQPEEGVKEAGGHNCQLQEVSQVMLTPSNIERQQQALTLEVGELEPPREAMRDLQERVATSIRTTMSRSKDLISRLVLS